MAEPRAVVVRRFEKMALRDPRAESALLEYLDKPTPSTVLVLVAGKLDRRTRIAQALEKRARVVHADGLDAAALPDWAQGRFIAQGLAATPSACRLLVQLVGESLLSIEEIIGDLNDLLDAPILMAEEVVSRENPPDVVLPEYQDGFTWTFYKLATIKGSVTIRCYGEGNGYYSEDVSFVEIKD